MDSLLWIAAILGLVEGLTEFLPVSSTGHLILAGHLLGFTGERAETFEIFIQLGAILAVVLFFLRRFLGLLRPPAGAPGFAGWRGLGLLIVTTLPAVGAGLLLHKTIKAHLFTPLAVAAGLAVGALWILAAERWPRRCAPVGLEQLTWGRALAIGVFQCLALWPGMSRSSSTILGAMLLGLDRRAATEYSFFAAVPVITLAGGYDLLKSLPALSGNDLPLFAVGFVVAFVSAWAAIQFLIRFVATHTLKLFGWYRLAVALIVLTLACLHKLG